MQIYFEIIEEGLVENFESPAAIMEVEVKL